MPVTARMREANMTVVMTRTLGPLDSSQNRLFAGLKISQMQDSREISGLESRLLESNSGRNLQFCVPENWFLSVRF